MLAPTQSLLVAPGAQATSSLLSAPPDLLDRLTWRLISDKDGSIAIAESSTGIVEIDTGQDAPNDRYDRVFTAPSTTGRYLAVWRWSLQEIAQTIVVATDGSITFANIDDVSHRLGRALSTQETGDIPFLLEMAAVVITDAAGYDDGWAASLTPIPKMLRMMSVELVSRALKNPGQYTQLRQQVGSYSFQMAQDTPGMKLSDVEEMMIRRAVFGRTTQSTQVQSGFVREQDEYWLRQQALNASQGTGVIA